LKPIDADGFAFDTDQHEAVSQCPAADSEQKGKIIETLQQGYTLNGKVIRFAKVVVGV
jgi:molecular chaperone GrpE